MTAVVDRPSNFKFKFKKGSVSIREVERIGDEKPRCAWMREACTMEWGYVAVVVGSRLSRFGSSEYPSPLRITVILPPSLRQLCLNDGDGSDEDQDEEGSGSDELDVGLNIEWMSTHNQPRKIPPATTTRVQFVIQTISFPRTEFDGQVRTLTHLAYASRSTQLVHPLNMTHASSSTPASPRATANIPHPFLPPSSANPHARNTHAPISTVNIATIIANGPPRGYSNAEFVRGLTSSSADDIEVGSARVN
ncbi:hypothetical protein BJ138DRAFT_1104936 [Hygrophoropsis aurantiaca]|uniref:Uncharacterized protein n=1 Tax=Hygrophoropsis aurantiaca TaxID=72124 RepID=A0ACB8A240_9AGAM|nr:hypothetical protein BJ138DRAFT_1104936 [Hygrophoropsis aurantiaca]